MIKLFTYFLLIVSIINHKIDLHQQQQVCSAVDIYFWGLVSASIVSCIGFFAAFLMIFMKGIMNENKYQLIIQIMFAFSCGALLGETMFHIIPQSYGAKQLVSQFNVSLTFTLSILSFLVLEGWFHQQGYGQMTAGHLNNLSSLLHNFIDGMAIGVSYSQGNPAEYIAITVGIIAHEIPRQMSDVAVLIRANYNNKQIVLSNGLINLISLVGAYIGLQSSHYISDTAKQYIIIYVSGNFLYIASDIWRTLLRHQNNILNIIEVAALLFGLTFSVMMEHEH